MRPEGNKVSMPIPVLLQGNAIAIFNSRKVPVLKVKGDVSMTLHKTGINSEDDSRKSPCVGVLY